VNANLKLSVGANNIFNTYPDRQPQSILNLLTTDSVLSGAPGYKLAAYGLPTSGGSIYGSNSPFGLNGGFYYARVAVKF